MISSTPIHYLFLDPVVLSDEINLSFSLVEQGCAASDGADMLPSYCDAVSKCHIEWLYRGASSIPTVSALFF